MTKYEKYKLDNGLTVLIHQDRQLTVEVINVLYKVGSRDEEKGKTGLAHLFEHLMFEGEYGGYSFDDVIQLAGGDCNAFTNADITNYYDILPPQNVEIGFQLESRRMRQLPLSAELIDTQRSVVIEEFKETALNVPYGDVWHELLPVAQKGTPYAWPVIGKSIERIKKMCYEDFEHFYNKHYTPDNAILCLSGPLSPKELKPLVDRYFGGLANGDRNGTKAHRFHHPKVKRVVCLEKNVPIDSLWICFNMCAHTQDAYYTTDILSDVLSSGKSSVLYEKLVKQKNLALSITAYVTGNIGPGLFVIEAKPMPGIKLEQLEQAIWDVLHTMCTSFVAERELQKHIHYVENSTAFAKADGLHKAMQLAFFEVVGNADLFDRSLELYKKITPEAILEQSKLLFTESNSTTLSYIAV